LRINPLLLPDLTLLLIDLLDYVVDRADAGRLSVDLADVGRLDAQLTECLYFEEAFDPQLRHACLYSNPLSWCANWISADIVIIEHFLFGLKLKLNDDLFKDSFTNESLRKKSLLILKHFLMPKLYLLLFEFDCWCESLKFYSKEVFNCLWEEGECEKLNNSWFDSLIFVNCISLSKSSLDSWMTLLNYSFSLFFLSSIDLIGTL